MYIMVLYDIPITRVRKRIAECCLDAGLERIQYSVFLGEGGRLLLRELTSRLRTTLGDEGGLVHILPIHHDQLNGTQVLFNAWAERTI